MILLGASPEPEPSVIPDEVRAACLRVLATKACPDYFRDAVAPWLEANP